MKYELTDLRYLDNITENNLLHTYKKTKISIDEIKSILKIAIKLMVIFSCKGRPVGTPIGVLGIVAHPEVEDYPRYYTSVLFPLRKIAPYIFGKEIIDWGYQFVPSLRMMRELKRTIREGKNIGYKIIKQNEERPYRQHYLKCKGEGI